MRYFFVVFLLLGCGPPVELANTQQANQVERKKKKKNKNDCHADLKCYKHCYKHCEKDLKHEQKECKVKKCLKEAKKLYLDWIESLQDQLDFCETSNADHTDIHNCIQNVLSSSPDAPTTTIESCWLDYSVCLDTVVATVSGCLADCACLID